MTSWPCSASRAAATDESTPPDIATTMRIVRDQPRKHEKNETTINTELTETTEALDVGGLRSRPRQRAKRANERRCNNSLSFVRPFRALNRRFAAPRRAHPIWSPSVG